jgi:hypothetical protein
LESVNHVKELLMKHFRGRYCLLSSFIDLLLIRLIGSSASQLFTITKTSIFNTKLFHVPRIIFSVTLRTGIILMESGERSGSGNEGFSIGFINGLLSVVYVGVGK